MRRITSTLFVCCLAAGLAFAGEETGKECAGCPAAASEGTALAQARKGIAAIPAADAKLPAETLAQVKEAREELMKTSFGKSMGPSFEACGWLMIAASAQPGSTPEATAVLKDMGATYCSIAKMFGGCAECECCEDASECCKGCMKDMTPDALAKKAQASAEASKKLFAAAATEMKTMTADQMAKIQVYATTLQEKSPCWPAFETATKALNDGFASLVKMGVPASDGKSARDGLVKMAAEIHTSLTACHSCEECEACDEAKPAETAAPEKSS